MGFKPISSQTLQRLPIYLNYLKSLSTKDDTNISATTIAYALDLNDVQVRKDLASVSRGGRPKVGYNKKELISDLEHFLGYDDVKSAVIVGVGNLGHALLSYDGFTAYGLNIIAGFDTDDEIIGTTVNGKQIFPISKLNDLCSRMKIRLGVITVPDNEAQSVCDEFMKSGILAILNFTNIHLKVREDVLVENINIAFSLGVLSKHLGEKLKAR